MSKKSQDRLRDPALKVRNLSLNFFDNSVHHVVDSEKYVGPEYFLISRSLHPTVSYEIFLLLFTFKFKQAAQSVNSIRLSLVCLTIHC